METLHQLGRQGLVDVLHTWCLEQVDNEFVNRARRERAVAQHFGQVINALKPLRDILGAGKVNLGMHDVQVIVEQRGLAIQDVLRVGIISLLYRCHAIEPHDLDGAGAVGKQRLETPLASLAHRIEREETPLELDRGLIAPQLADVVEDAAVDIAEGEIVQQVVVGADAQFLLEQLGTLGAHAMQVLYVGMSQVRHLGSTGIRQAPGPWGA